MNYIHCFSPDELLSTISSSYLNDIVVHILRKYLSSPVIPFIFVDYVGYVHDFSPTKRSFNSNLFFDIKLETSPQQVNTVRIMTNNAPKRQLFVDKKISSQPVRMTEIKQTTSGFGFFNSNRGSRLEDVLCLSFLSLTISIRQLLT